MILASSRPAETGRRYVGIDLDGHAYPEQPFVILREATLHQWIEDSLRRFRHPPDAISDLSQCWFYEVSAD
jgi:hypothetical protein